MGGFLGCGAGGVCVGVMCGGKCGGSVGGAVWANGFQIRCPRPSGRCHACSPHRCDIWRQPQTLSGGLGDPPGYMDVIIMQGGFTTSSPDPKGVLIAQGEVMTSSWLHGRYDYAKGGYDLLS